MEKRSFITVPGYELSLKCGSGASSEVWIAYDCHGVRRAVRIVRRENGLNAVPENFRMASYRTFAENSTHLLHFLYAGETEECYYYVSDPADNVVDGDLMIRYTADTLFHRLKVHSYSLEEILSCVLDLLRGLEDLHNRSLAHNDLKPENILFIRNDLKLADPGLLHPAAEKIRSGTEGFRPGWEASGIEADIYALGKIIYCMITGRCDPGPFPELNTNGLDRRFFPLNEIALRCCDEDPCVRYGNCAEVRRDVLKLLQSTVQRRKFFISPGLIRLLIILCVLQSICLTISLYCSGLRFLPGSDLFMREKDPQTVSGGICSASGRGVKGYYRRQYPARSRSGIFYRMR